MKKVQSERRLWYDFVLPKRQAIRENLQAYRNVTGKKTKIRNRLARKIVKQWVALNYSDKKSVVFSTRNWELGGDKRAKMLEAISSFDYGEMKLGDLELSRYEDIALKWVGIFVWWSWNDLIWCPSVRYVDPLTWIPDPYQDVNDWPRFHGFEMEVSVWQLKKWWFFNIWGLKTKTEQQLHKKIKSLVESGQSYTDAVNDQSIIALRDLNYQEKSIPGTETYKVYVHYTIFDNKKRMTVRGNDRTELIALQEIKPVRGHETVVDYIPRPVVATNFSPVKDDPFGESFLDLLLDKQYAIQELENLQLIMARHAALWDTTIIDKNVVSNPDAFKKKTDKPLYVFGDLSRSNWVPFVSMPKQQIHPDTRNVTGSLQSNAYGDANMDEGTLGMQSWWQQTAAENIRLQRNTNLRLYLDRTIVLNWMKKFRDILWYRVYQEHFPKWKKKQIAITSWLGKVPLTIKRDDFISVGDLRVRIQSQTEKKEKEDEKKIAFMANIGVFLQNQWSAFSNNYALRKLAIYSWMSEEEAFVMIPETIDEIRAKMDVELINNWEEANDVEVGEDHQTYLAILEQAHDNKFKRKAMLRRRMALMEEMQQQKQQPQDQGAAMQNQATITNQMLQQQWNSTPSLQDISAG